MSVKERPAEAGSGSTIGSTIAAAVEETDAAAPACPPPVCSILDFRSALSGPVISHPLRWRALVSCFKSVSQRHSGLSSTSHDSGHPKKHALAPLGSRRRACESRCTTPPPEPSQEKLQRSLPHAHMALSRAGSRSPIAHIAGLYTHAAQERLNSKNWLLVHRARQPAISGGSCEARNRT